MHLDQQFRLFCQRYTMYILTHLFKHENKTDKIDFFMRIKIGPLQDLQELPDIRVYQTT